MHGEDNIRKLCVVVCTYIYTRIRILYEKCAKQHAIYNNKKYNKNKYFFEVFSSPSGWRMYNCFEVKNSYEK